MKIYGKGSKERLLQLDSNVKKSLIKYQCGLKKKIAYAEGPIEIYLAAMEQQSRTNVSIKEKLEAYQQLNEKYETQREELRTEGLEQKTLTDPDSRRMKNNGALDICYNVQATIDGGNHFAIHNLHLPFFFIIFLTPTCI